MSFAKELWLQKAEFTSLLKSIANLSKLASSPFLNSALVRIEFQNDDHLPSDLERRAALRKIVEKHIDGIKSNTKRDGLYSQTLKCRYFDRLNRTETASLLGYEKALRSYDRLHNEAILHLGVILFEAEQVAENTTPIKTNKDDYFRTLLRREPFIPRPKLLNKILTALDQESRHWMVFIYGNGGMGKTTLASEVAHICRERGFFEGIIWTHARTKRLALEKGIVDVEPSIFSLSDLFDDIGEALNKKTILTSDVGQKPIEVFQALQERKYLLVIDNFETLPPEEKERILAFLNNRRNFPDNCKVMVTGRYKEIEDVRMVEVEGMDFEECRALVTSVLHEQDLSFSIVESNTIIEELKVQTSGNPLAIQWIIGQVSQTRKSLVDIIKSLQSFETEYIHDTEPLLEYLFKGSYEILSPVGKRILHALSVLPGKLTRSALSYIIAIDMQSVNEEIPNLSRMSLITGENNRFGLLQITKNFVQREVYMDEPLFEQEVLRNAHKYYLELFRGVGRTLMNNIIEDRGNIIAVIKWCERNEIWDSVIQLSEALLPYLYSEGFWQDYDQVAKIAAQASKMLGDKASELKFLVSFLSPINHAMHRYNEATEFALKGLEIARSQEDDIGVGLAFQMLGLIEFSTGRFAEAKNFLANAHVIFYNQKNKDLLLEVEYNIADVYIQTAELDEARKLLVNRLEKAENLTVRAETLALLGTLSYKEGVYHTARSNLLEAKNIEDKLDRKPKVAYILGMLARVEYAVGRLDDATAYAQDASSLYSVIGLGVEATEMRDLAKTASNRNATF